MNASAFAVIVVGLVLATLPMLGDRSLLAVPVLKVSKSAWVRVLEFIVAYGIWIGFGRFLESQVGQVNAQGWQFYVVTFLMFVVGGFPAFAWRYLWRHA